MLTRLLAGLAALLPAVAFVVLALPSSAPTSAPARDCRPLDVSDAAPAVVDDLLAGGWRSTPLDHREALYAPGCLVGEEVRP